MWSNRKKILLVDDEHDITLTLRTILEKGGFEVVSLNDPILALQSFKPRYYDLLVLDGRMPQMNGFELYQQLRKKDSRVKACFLIFISNCLRHTFEPPQNLKYRRATKSQKGVLIPGRNLNEG